VYAQHLPPGRGPGIESQPPFSDAFDFSFDSYATPTVVKVVYALTVVACVLAYVGNVLLSFALFLPDADLGFTKIAGSAVPGLVALVVGWIPALIVVLAVRVGLEQSMAAVRTAMDVRAFRERYLGRSHMV
jgi:hypothetical protein